MLVSPADLVAVAKATITECSVKDVEQCLDSETLLIDVREPQEYMRGRIPGAIHIPRGMLEFEIHKLVETAANRTVSAEEQKLVLYCGTGGRSALAAQSMESLGYRQVRSMAGGLVAWAAAQLPLELPA